MKEYLARDCELFAVENKDESESKDAFQVMVKSFDHLWS